MKCKICDETTDNVYLINGFDVEVCQKCSKQIFFTVAKALAQNRTIFDINARSEREPVTLHREMVADVLNYLHVDLLKIRKSKYNVETLPVAYLKLISARINNGHTLEELKAVAYYKYKEWYGDDVMKKFIRVSTLYGRTNFENYLAEIGNNMPKWNVVNTAEQRKIIKELNSYGVRGEVNAYTDKLAKQLMKLGYTKKHFLNLYLINKI